MTHTIRAATSRATLAAFAATLLACTEPPPAGVTTNGLGGTPVPKATHLRGQVLDLASSTPLSGTRVEAAGLADTTDSDGHYNLQNLRVGAADLIATRPGYDTLRVILPLPGGDQLWNLRMRAAVATATH